MHDMDDTTRKEVLGEAIMDELRAIRELVADVPVISGRVYSLKEDVAELKSDMKVVKAAVKDQYRILRQHDVAISKS